jgi:hypothetical protein
MPLAAGRTEKEGICGILRVTSPRNEGFESHPPHSIQNWGGNVKIELRKMDSKIIYCFDNDYVCSISLLIA